MSYIGATIESILDYLNDAVCIVDENCVVRFWNSTAAKLYDTRKNDIVGRPITDYFPTALLPKVVSEERSFENVYNSPREESHNIITAKPIYVDGSLVGGISCDRDISEMISLAKQLDKTKLDLKILEEEVSTISENRYNFDNLIGNDMRFKEVIALCKKVSDSKINILITGESGTGKEVFSRAIHIESKRKGHFIPINCSAIPAELMESELFGYEGGAFTGALRKGKVGKFELAHNGTLFLDEIGDMPINMQPKILRVLEDGLITRVGGSKSIKVDVRIIAATNKDLKKMIEEGTFRKDLYYRLNSILVQLPPIRERKDDIPQLIRTFTKQYCINYRTNIPKIPDDIMEILVNYHWEGNIRELKNIVERLVILVKNNNIEKININMLPSHIIKQGKDKVQKSKCLDLNNIIKDAEINAITKAMQLSNGNKANAAKLLNIPRSTLYFKLDKYNIIRVD